MMWLQTKNLMKRGETCRENLIDQYERAKYMEQGIMDMPIQPHYGLYFYSGFNNTHKLWGRCAFFSIIIMQFLISSCNVMLHSFHTGNYCYQPKNNFTQNMILYGYFSTTDNISIYEGYPPIEKSVKIESNYIFYNDGVFLKDFHETQFNSNDSIGYNGGMALWGSYKIENDTIKAFFITAPKNRPYTPWGYIWFKILDKYTIQILCLKFNDEITLKDIELNKSSSKYNTILRYIAFDSIPDPNKSWIKNKKWFWCDKNEYKNWRKLKTLK